MSGELVLQTGFNRPYLFNQNDESNIKARFLVKPSDEVRVKLDKNNVNAGVDLCIVLDMSTSMRKIIDNTGVECIGYTKDEYGRTVKKCTGGKSRLDIAVDAAKKVIEKAENCDNISCLVYSDNVTQLFINRCGSEKEEMMNKLDSLIRSGIKGNTNISAAIRDARNILVKNNNLKLKRILFLTDGQPTVDSENDGIREGQYLSEYNISIDCVGLGNDENISYLEKISKPSNGTCSLINEAYEVERLFVSIFERAKDVVITNAKLKIKFSEAVRVKDHYRGAPENSYLGKTVLNENRICEINLGHIEKNRLYTYYFDMSLMGIYGYCGPMRVAEAILEYKIPALYRNETITSRQNVIIEVGSNLVHSYQRESDIDIAYMLAEVKKLEEEAQEAMNVKDEAKVISKYNSIIEKYKNLNNVKLAKGYENALEQYKREKKISPGKINELVNESTKTTYVGMAEAISEYEYSKLFK